MGTAATSTALADRREDSHAALPRPLRWILALPVPPLALGACVLLAYGAVSASLHVSGLLASLGLAGTALWLVEIGYGLYLAWAPVALLYLVRGSERDLGDLLPVLEGELHLDALCREVFAVGPRTLALGAAVGLAVALCDLWLIFAHTLVQSPTPAAAAWVVARELVVCLAIFTVLAWGVGAALRLSRLARTRARPSLLDPSQFAALARNGTRLALLWTVVLAIGVPLFALPSVPWDAVAMRTGMILEGVLLLPAVVAMLLPTWGAHVVLRERRASELRAVRREIQAARRSGEATRLPGLLAWEGRMAAVSEWPFDARSLGRLGLYLLIPLASWIGGALVERAVDRALG